MKISTVFSTAGLMSLLCCGAAFAQVAKVPVASGVGLNRPGVGSQTATPGAPHPAAVSPAPVAISTPFSSWTGIYVGGDLGGFFGAASTSSGTPGWASQSLNTTGLMGGGYVGYNYQLTPMFVLGVEGDFQGNTSTAQWRFQPAFNITTRVEQNWVASVNGRLGVAFFDHALFYAIGGAAWGQDSATLTSGNIPNLPPDSRTAHPSGWDVGGGVEYAFDAHWVGRLEYRYYDFGSFDRTNIGALLPLHVHSSANTVRVGFAYLFSTPAPVIVAKY